MMFDKVLADLGLEEGAVQKLVARYGEEERRKMSNGARESARRAEDALFLSFLQKKRDAPDLTGLDIREVVVDTTGREFHPYLQVAHTHEVAVADLYVMPRGKVRVRYVSVEYADAWRWDSYFRAVELGKFMIPDLVLASEIYDQEPQGYYVIPVMARYTRRLLEWCVCAGNSGTGVCVLKDKQRNWPSFFKTFYVIDEQPVVE